MSVGNVIGVTSQPVLVCGNHQENSFFFKAKPIGCGQKLQDEGEIEISPNSDSLIP